MSDGRVANGRQELRCFCRRQPLLAVYGVDSEGRPFVHVKVYKQRRIYSETLHRAGTVEIRCRECNRWNRIFIQEGRPACLEPVCEPAVLQNMDLDDAGLPEGAAVMSLSQPTE